MSRIPREKATVMAAQMKKRQKTSTCVLLSRSFIGILTNAAWTCSTWHCPPPYFCSHMLETGTSVYTDHANARRNRASQYCLPKKKAKFFPRVMGSRSRWGKCAHMICSKLAISLLYCILFPRARKTVRHRAEVGPEAVGFMGHGARCPSCGAAQARRLRPRPSRYAKLEVLLLRRCFCSSSLSFFTRPVLHC
jgi:hypothetical protein